MPGRAGETPQQRAARVSGERRSERARERRELEARRRQALTPGHHSSCPCDSCELERARRLDLEGSQELESGAAIPPAPETRNEGTDR